MLTQLRAIFDLIIQFQSTQESMYTGAMKELEARQALEKKAEQKTKEVLVKYLFVTNKKPRRWSVICFIF